MQSSYGSAITHVQSGLKILCEIEHNKESQQQQYGVFSASENPYVSVKILEEIFAHLDLQVIQVRLLA
jgi:hypothetical protein